MTNLSIVTRNGLERADTPAQRFRFTLHEAPTQRPDPSRFHLPQALDDPGRVLVVEDDDSVRKSMERLLNTLGVSTASFASAEALLAVGPTARDTCVVSDLKLPGLSGLQLLAALRQRGYPHPLILMTAYDSTTIRKMAESYDVAAFLPKPLNGAALLAAIRTATDR